MTVDEAQVVSDVQTLEMLRMLLNFEGEAESITTDAVIAELVDQLPEAQD